MTTVLERARSLTATRDDDAYRSGHWSYWNDEACPYNDQLRVRSWRQGYVDARADHAMEEPRR